MENKHKSLKVAANVHRELKIFIATHPEENMIDFVGTSILAMLVSKGHKTTKNNKIEK